MVKSNIRRDHTKEEKEKTEDTSETQKTECPECGGEVSQSGSELVCDDCGLVIEQDQIDHGPEWRAFGPQERDQKSRVGAPMDESRHDRGLQTQIDFRNKDAYGRSLNASQRQRVERIRKWQTRTRTKDSTERNLQYALSEIDRMTSALGVQNNVRDIASNLYRTSLNEDLIRGRSIEGVATACLYISLRQLNIPRSLQEMESVSRVDKKEIARTHSYLVKELNLEVQPSDPKEYVARFCSQLDLSESVDKKARDILDKAEEARLKSGRSPIGLAAAAIYTAALLCNEKRTQQEVSEVTEVTEVTIRNRYKEMLAPLGIEESEKINSQ